MAKQDLTDAFNKFNEKNEFKAGDIVEWKLGLKHKSPDGPFIVHEVLEKPVAEVGPDSGSPYFNIPLDLVLGSFSEDGSYLTYHYDSRRFQPAD